ncbi:MAG TPA: ATP-binding protein, partial [Longimicrobium sp.]
ILESITDAFVAVDREWRFTYLNRRADELARRTVGRDEPFAGRSVWEVFPGSIEGPFHSELNRALDTGVPVAFEAHAPLLDVWFSVRAYPAADGLSIYFSDNTERRRAEEERARLLREAERGRAFLEAVVRQMPEGVLIGEAPDGRIVIHNPEAERLLGHPVGEDTRLADYASHGMLHPDGRPFAAEEYPLARVLLRGDTLAGEEVHYRRGDGTRAVLQIRGAPVLDPGGEIEAGVVTFTDATEQRRRRRADQLLARTSELLASSLESAATLQRVADLVAGSLADYCIVHVEEGGELRAPGIAHSDPRKREIVRGLLRRFPVDPRGAHPAVVCLRTGEPQLIEQVSDEMMGAISTGPEHTEMLRDLGLGSAMVVPMQARGRTVGAISFGRTGGSPPYGEADMEVALELSRRAALAVDNARLYEEAQRASRAREEVLAVVSHDLRNPLNAIVLGASLLEEFSGDAWSARDRQQLRAIRNASQQMEGLIQDLVEVAALESGSSALSPEPLSPRDLVSGAVELFEEMAAQHSLTLRAEVAPDLPELQADRARVLRILSNLLGNALKFTPAGGTVTVSAAPLEGAVRFSVADTGPGIAPQHLPHLFDRYWQARRGEKQGLGLGLAISKGITDAHGGRIWAESEPGKGATFHFTLPAGN